MPSYPEPDPSGVPRSGIDDVVSALSGILLVGALVVAIMYAWSNPAVAARYAVREAKALIYDGDYTQAGSLLESTLPRYDSAALRLNLSYAYLARRDGDRSARQARLAVSAAPEELRPAALAQLGRAYAFSGQTADALEVWGRARAVYYANPGSAPGKTEAQSALWQTGMLQWRSANWPASRSAFEMLLSGDDLYARSAALKLAQLAAPASRSEAERLLSRAPLAVQTQVVSPEVPYALPNLRVPGLAEGIPMGELQRASTALRQTLQAADTAAKQGTDEAASTLLWGSYFLQQRESILAREYLQRAVELRPDSVPALARLGLALLTVGEEKTASNYLRRAAALDPSDPLPHYALVQLYIAREDWAGVEGEFTVLRRLQPNSMELHMQLAEYHRLRGDYDKAEEAYIDAVAAQLAAPASAGGLGPSASDPALTLARFYTDTRGLGCEKGFPAGRQAAALHPNDPAAHDAVGWALVICREPKDALVALDQAVQGAPEVPRYRYHRAKAYSLLGRYDDARTEYRRVVNLDPKGPWEQLALTDLAALPPEVEL